MRKARIHETTENRTELFKHIVCRPANLNLNPDELEHEVHRDLVITARVGFDWRVQ